MAYRVLQYLRAAAEIPVFALRTFIGVHYAKGFAIEEPLPEWKEELRGARVLIVGTGPSLDRVDADYLKDFDVAILINFAVCRDIPIAQRYLYTVDLPRLIQVLESASVELSAIGKPRTIFLNNFTPFKVALPKCMSDVTVVAGESYRFNLWDPGRRFLRRRVYQVKPASDDEMRGWLEGTSAFRIPNVSGTSAFGAMLFAARFRPKSINLIGVDLNTGRSNDLRDELGDGDFDRYQAPYFRIEALIREAGVPVSNDSWVY